MVEFRQRDRQWEERFLIRCDWREVERLSRMVGFANASAWKGFARGSLLCYSRTFSAADGLAKVLLAFSPLTDLERAAGAYAPKELRAAVEALRALEE
jgi:hypothetical protein